MIIINQDRETILDFINGIDFLECKLTKHNGINYGINLLLNNHILGTFDTLNEVVDEMQNIINCKYNYYVIGGFDDYKNNFKK